MSGSVAELRGMLEPKNGLAKAVVEMYDSLRNNRAPFDQEQVELRNYIFATDTTKTQNQKLPWRNSTTVPKLTQIRDNLHANYIAALFPNDEWMKWVGDSVEDDNKAQAIETYLRNKTRQAGFKETVSRLIYDYIDTGNAFGDVQWVDETKVVGDETIKGYVGPQIIRTSLNDIYINPIADSFESSPKITRTLMSLGELKILAEEQPNLKYIQEAIAAAGGNRASMRGAFTIEDFKKAGGYSVDGFGSLYDYYQSPYVELIELQGDIHDGDGTLLRNHVITIMDRAFVIRQEPIESWLPHGTMAHVGWRLRTDNLYAQGPLHNLVGMQYRIDHLENLKADVFDLIAFPPLKIRGEVEEFEWAPFAEIHMDAEDSDVTMLVPDTTALQADLQIQILEDKMEQYAGAPREAMGIRTPGEKTAFEVEQLGSAAARIFNEKVLNFETQLLEPLLNSMLEVAKRNMTVAETVRVMDDDIGVELFMDITKEDITATGKVRPQGARHFAAQRQLVQNLTGIFNSPVGQLIAPHTSSKALVKMIEDAFGIERYGLFRDNIAVIEQAETQRIVQAAEQQVMQEQMVDTEDPDVPPEEQPQGGNPFA
jgi:hypothetical protein